MGVQELQHDCLSIAMNRKQLIIKCLLIWISLTQGLEVKEKSASAGTVHFLFVSCLLERVFVPFPSFWKGV